MAPRPERSSEKMIPRSAEAAFVFENRGPSGVVGGLVPPEAGDRGTASRHSGFACLFTISTPCSHLAPT